jgi:hypothetical protein
LKGTPTVHPNSHSRKYRHALLHVCGVRTPQCGVCCMGRYCVEYSRQGICLCSLFYGYGTFLHWGYESTILDAHNPICNTAYQHYYHHAQSYINKPIYTGFFFKVRSTFIKNVLRTASMDSIVLYGDTPLEEVP